MTIFGTAVILMHSSWEWRRKRDFLFKRKIWSPRSSISPPLLLIKASSAPTPRPSPPSSSLVLFISYRNSVSPSYSIFTPPWWFFLEENNLWNLSSSKIIRCSKLEFIKQRIQTEPTTSRWKSLELLKQEEWLITIRAEFYWWEALSWSLQKDQDQRPWKIQSGSSFPLEPPGNSTEALATLHPRALFPPQMSSHAH